MTSVSADLSHQILRKQLIPPPPPPPFCMASRLYLQLNNSTSWVSSSHLLLFLFLFLHTAHIHPAAAPHQSQHATMACDSALTGPWGLPHRQPVSASQPTIWERTNRRAQLTSRLRQPRWRFAVWSDSLVCLSEPVSDATAYLAALLCLMPQHSVTIA